MPRYYQSDRIKRLFLFSQQIRLGKGEVVLGNDIEPDGVYYISSGYVKVYSLHDDGDEYLHIIYGEGEIFPLSWAYLGEQPLSLFYETISESVLQRISRERFNSLIRGNLVLANAVSRQLAQQFSIFCDRVDNLEYKKARERIIYRLLFLAGRFGVREGDDIVIKAPITHETFANSINLSRESVSRQLENLYRQQVIERNHGNIRIKDLRALMDNLSSPANINNWNLPRPNLERVFK